MTFTARGKNYSNGNLSRSGNREHQNNAGKNQVRL